MTTEAMIPVRPRAGEILPGPEEPGPRICGSKPLSVTFRALGEIEALKRPLGDLEKRLDGFEQRLAALEKPIA